MLLGEGGRLELGGRPNRWNLHGEAAHCTRPSHRLASLALNSTVEMGM